MRETRKQPPSAEPPKPEKGSEKRPSTANKRLAEQTRKILGKHYASKYRVR
jgi:hypothetical protein